ncbi:MAG: nitroreductase family protein [Actinomycetota bacterium]|nr:nitroreductase family protein [Actinomycetota bacterium]
MELREAVHRRRMTRSYTDEPVDPQVVDDMLAAAVRAPSAGFSQGWAFLVLDTAADVGRYWAATTDPDRSADRWLTGMRRAPVLIVAFSCKEAYLSRYAEDDKGWRDRAQSRWPVPYWHLDTAMAVMLMLLVAQDAGLGSCFFGVPGTSTDAVRQAFGVPADHSPVGVVSVGHRATPLAQGSPDRRARRPLADVVHRGSWQD